MSEFSVMRYESDCAAIGTFFCPATHPVFSQAGEIEGYTVVFPRTSVTIEQFGREPVVADPNVVMFYNKGQMYRRGKISDQGDLCDWFGFGQTAVFEVLRRVDPSVDDRWPLPFGFTHGPSDSHLYVRQRLLIHYLNRVEQPDPLFIEEKALEILQSAVQHSYLLHRRTKNPGEKTTSLHLELVQATRELLALQFTDPLSLSQISATVYSSPYHLSRLFRKYTGFTIHTYRNQLRLRTALAQVAQPDVNLTELGLSLGFSSHSHFSRAFRHAFGTAPSTFRNTATTHRVQEMSKILTAL